MIILLRLSVDWSKKKDAVWIRIREFDAVWIWIGSECEHIAARQMVLVYSTKTKVRDQSLKYICGWSGQVEQKMSSFIVYEMLIDERTNSNASKALRLKFGLSYVFPKTNSASKLMITMVKRLLETFLQRLRYFPSIPLDQGAQYLLQVITEEAALKSIRFRNTKGGLHDNRNSTRGSKDIVIELVECGEPCVMCFILKLFGLRHDINCLAIFDMKFYSTSIKKGEFTKLEEAKRKMNADFAILWSWNEYCPTKEVHPDFVNSLSMGSYNQFVELVAFLLTHFVNVDVFTRIINRLFEPKKKRQYEEVLGELNVGAYVAQTATLRPMRIVNLNPELQCITVLKDDEGKFFWDPNGSKAVDPNTLLRNSNGEIMQIFSEYFELPNALFQPFREALCDSF